MKRGEIMKNHNCNKKHKHQERTSANPCTSASTDNCQCINEPPCNEEPALSPQSCPQDNHIKICGRVTYRGQGIHLATVVIMRNRQVVAECLTDCDGCYEFKGQRANYSLRAHKGNRRSRIRTVSCSNGDKFEVNFNFM